MWKDLFLVIVWYVARWSVSILHILSVPLNRPPHNKKVFRAPCKVILFWGGFQNSIRPCLRSSGCKICLKVNEKFILYNCCYLILQSRGSDITHMYTGLLATWVPAFAAGRLDTHISLLCHLVEMASLHQTRYTTPQPHTADVISIRCSPVQQTILCAAVNMCENKCLSNSYSIVLFCFVFQWFFINSEFSQISVQLINLMTTNLIYFIYNINNL